MVSVLPANLISCRVSYFVFVVVTERTSSSRQISEIHVKPFLVKVTLKLSLKHSEYVQLRVKLRVFFFNVTSVSWKEELFTRWEASKT